MKINDYYQSESKWLKAGDLQGRKVSVIIDHVEEVEFKNDKTKKMACLFKGKDKGLILNKTNAMLISEHHGADTDDWTGKTIKIYPTTTDFGGERVECIRVEQYIPPESDDPNDAVPF